MHRRDHREMHEKQFHFKHEKFLNVSRIYHERDVIFIMLAKGATGHTQLSGEKSCI